MFTSPEMELNSEHVQPETLVRRFKLAVSNFNKCQKGMNTVEAIILLFVAAVVLVVFFTLIWPLIRDKVYEQLENLFGQTGER
jgi:hypothetical protein